MGMADAVLSAFLQVVFQQLASPILEELGLQWGVKKELKKLSRTLLRIRAVLNDAEERQIHEEAVMVWMRDLKDVTYDADDILDEVTTKIRQSKSEAEIQTDQNLVCNFLSSFSSNRVFFRPDIAYKIKAIIEKIDELAKEKVDLHLREVGEWRIQVRERPQTSSLIDKNSIFGRHEDRNKIIEMLLCEESSGKGVPVVPIIGMGGLGKTTLAQFVYNDERIKKNFKLRIWVCVFEDFDTRRLTKVIIASATKKNSHFMDLDPLQIELQQILRGKKFLLVLDDVWNENRSDWNALSAPFRFGAKGSKIMVTTRSNIVAKTMGTIAAYYLDVLPFADCWSLFKEQAFVDGNSDAHPNLITIGEEIVKKCGGLPLAAKTLGGILYSNVDEDEWENILRSEIWDLHKDQNDILPALRLSYQHLPAKLKQCFLFCSIFPKGYVFDKEKLIHLWIAQGFIQMEGRREIEDIGNDYFNNLLGRSFFQCSYNYKRKPSMLTMHDLIHDLAQSISGDECFRMEDDNPCNISKTARHASFLCHRIEPMMLKALYMCAGLRTFLMLQEYPNCIEQISLDPFLKLQYLRVLDLSHTDITELPNLIGNLKLLRYLDLSHTFLKSLPNAVTGLYNMQTLKLKDCSMLIELPKDMKRLINLRHLDLESCSKLISTPSGLGKLTCLQTLSTFIVGKESGYGIGELKDMVNLRGAIQISKLENVASAEEAKDSKLKNKKHLYKLELQWSDDNVGRRKENEEEVLEGLEPHMNIKELRIENYGGTKFPSWMRSPVLSNVIQIGLYNCANCKCLPPLGQLLLLKNLHVDGMLGVKHVGRDFCGNDMVKGFPSLETLKFKDMPNLEVWSGVDEGEFPCLRDLIILNCPILRQLPVLPPILTKLEIRNCENLIALPMLPSLEDLVLAGCDEKVLSFLSNLTSLSSLHISQFQKLETLPELSLRFLKELEIEDCDELVSLSYKEGLQGLTTLEYLVIWGSPKLMCFPEEGLPNTLQYLWIRGCNNLKSLPKGLHGLTAIRGLVVNDCPQLTLLPEEGFPATLTYLSIFSCPKLKFLPEGLFWNLASLKELEISDCQQLTSLPKGLHHLVSLQLLEISYCPRLKSLPEHGMP